MGITKLENTAREQTPMLQTVLHDGPAAPYITLDSIADVIGRKLANMPVALAQNLMATSQGFAPMIADEAINAPKTAVVSLLTFCYLSEMGASPMFVLPQYLSIAMCVTTGLVVREMGVDLRMELPFRLAQRAFLETMGSYITNNVKRFAKRERLGDHMKGGSTDWLDEKIELRPCKEGEKRMSQPGKIARKCIRAALHDREVMGQAIYVIDRLLSEHFDALAAKIKKQHRIAIEALNTDDTRYIYKHAIGPIAVYTLLRRAELDNRAVAETAL